MMKRILAVLAVVLCVAAGSMPLWKAAAKWHFKWFVISTNIYQDTPRRAHLRSDQINQPDYSRYIPCPTFPSTLTARTARSSGTRRMVA